MGSCVREINQSPPEFAVHNTDDESCASAVRASTNAWAGAPCNARLTAQFSGCGSRCRNP